jgi:hypothetical protein
VQKPHQFKSNYFQRKSVIWLLKNSLLQTNKEAQLINKKCHEIKLGDDLTADDCTGVNWKFFSRLFGFLN